MILSIKKIEIGSVDSVLLFVLVTSHPVPASHVAYWQFTQWNNQEGEIRFSANQAIIPGGFILVLLDVWVNKVLCIWYTCSLCEWQRQESVTWHT